MGRRFPRLMHGLLVVDKPLGPSSMAVVKRVRFLAGGCKTGHGGTLDPLASGVLVCLLGDATKACEQVMDHDKTYYAAIDLSATTSTDDAEGEVYPRQPQQIPSMQTLVAACSQLIGIIPQAPPSYSAIKVAGRAAYQLARRGQQLELPERPVRIDAIEVLGYQWPIVRIRVRCGRGTYIRVLARQIGALVGCGGYLTALRRERIGRFDLSQARRFDALTRPIAAEDLIALS